jgi:energy-coupling factor transporter ATP-binding protein EcfA2
MHLKSIRIQNLRVFKDVNIPFALASPNEKLSNVHLFLGTNGSGKSSLLKAIALAAVAEVLPSSGLRLYSLVRRVQKKGSVEHASCQISAEFELDKQDIAKRASVPKNQSNGVESTISLNARGGFNDSFGTITYPEGLREMVWDDRSPAALVLGYGATRRVDSTKTSQSTEWSGKERSLRYSRIAGLFEDHLQLLPLSSWLPQYSSKNPGRHSQVVTLVNKLLEDVNVTLLPKAVDGEYLFQMGGAQLPLAALSDGYRAYIGWISDMLYHVCMGCPDGVRLVDNEGIVLVDEIDLHLHPQWQRVVIPRLGQVLPKLQFFFTSHSPLIAGSLQAANIMIVQMKSVGDGANVVPCPVDVYGWSSDQILSSELFDETESRNQETVVAIENASAKARKGDRGAARDLMSVLADGLSSTNQVVKTGKGGAKVPAAKKAVAAAKKSPAKKVATKKTAR